MKSKQTKIPSFTIPKDTKSRIWERAKLNVDGENIPVHRIKEIVLANCPYLKVDESSYFIRRVADEFGDHVYVYYAVELCPIAQKAMQMKRKRKNSK
jgi:hypothetical protein